MNFLMISIKFICTLYISGILVHQNSMAMETLPNDVLRIIVDIVVKDAEENFDKDCNLLSLSLVNKKFRRALFHGMRDPNNQEIIFSKDRKIAIQVIDANHELSKRKIGWALKGLDGNINQQQVLLLDTFKNGDGALVDIQTFLFINGTSINGFKLIALKPELFFTSPFPNCIWLITSRAELTKFLLKMKKSGQDNPYGLSQVLNKNKERLATSLFILYRSGVDLIEKFQYKYGEFDKINKLSSRSLYDYFSDPAMQWLVEGGIARAPDWAMPGFLGPLSLF